MVLDATEHVNAVAQAWAAQLRTGHMGYVGVDANNSVQLDLHPADVVTFGDMHQMLARRQNPDQPAGMETPASQDAPSGNDDTGETKNADGAAILDPASAAVDMMDIAHLQRHATAALVSINVRTRMQFSNRNTSEHMSVLPKTYTTVAVIDNVCTLRTDEQRFPRFMLLDIMRALLDLLPPQYVAVRTGVLTSDVYRDKLRTELAAREAMDPAHASSDAAGQPFFELTEQTLVLHRTRPA